MWRFAHFGPLWGLPLERFRADRPAVRKTWRCEKPPPLLIKDLV